MAYDDRLHWSVQYYERNFIQGLSTGIIVNKGQLHPRNQWAAPLAEQSTQERLPFHKATTSGQVWPTTRDIK